MKMKKLLFQFLLTSWILLIYSVIATGSVNKTVSDLKVEFIGDIPAPGKLKNFSFISKTSDSLEDVNASYFLGYNSEFLYVYIEADGDSLVSRDRGYQNGDGFHLVIGESKDDGSDTDEFYVLGFSAKEGWSRKMSWYYNVDLKMGSLGDEVKFKTFVKEGRICLEALIPWRVIKPYHPWIGRKKIGFNLCFVKAVKEYDKIYSFIVQDNKMQSEQSKRKYINLSFEAPDKAGKSYSLPNKNNIKSGDELTVSIAGYNQKASRTLFLITVENAGKDIIREKAVYVNNPKGEYMRQLSLGKMDLPSGNYFVRVRENNDEIGYHTVTIVEDIDFEAVEKIIDSGKGSVSNGVISSVKFMISETELELSKLKQYESCGKINSAIAEIKRSVRIIQSGTDPFENKRGTYRRAYASQADGVIRPYSVYVPEGYDKNRKYPLLVYLHGSGQDDRILEKSRFLREGYIVVAPNGMGVSNCFSTKESQQDIRESVEDVIKEFSIDISKIVLSGFSMGGYGVLRTFYENPSRYAAIAILSGHPDLANRMVSKNNPNFLDKENLNSFSKVPVLIYHSKDDLNCPYVLMKTFAENLREINSNITFVDDYDRGHGSMSSEAEKSYNTWLNNLIK